VSPAVALRDRPLVVIAADDRDIPLTARVQEIHVARGYDAGADDYLKKPFSPDELKARVQATLGVRAER
jgi:DNA-binding response OmpR family regulator